MGLDVGFASNGQEAINLVKDAQASSDQYDAIIMDIHMPIMDGKEAVQKIRNLGYSNKIMALTAATMKGVEDHLISLGFSAVLSKPVDKHLLYNQLAESLKSQSSAIETPNLQHTDAAETKSQQILLVEDDHDAADITRMLLESLGASVTVVHSAKGCMQEVGKNQYFHKVLLDLHLPDAHGFELAPQLSAMENVEQIIVVSGELVEQQQLDTYLCDKSLLKPLNKDKLSLLLAE
jgi:CheY-like chemotaxis protein